MYVAQSCYEHEDFICAPMNNHAAKGSPIAIAISKLRQATRGFPSRLSLNCPRIEFRRSKSHFKSLQFHSRRQVSKRFVAGGRARIN